jgi:hypothetical protein
MTEMNDGSFCYFCKVCSRFYYLEIRLAWTKTNDRVCRECRNANRS